MKLHYYADTDSLYIELKDTPGIKTREIASGLQVDLDAKGEVVGIDGARPPLRSLDAGNGRPPYQDDQGGLRSPRSRS